MIKTNLLRVSEGYYGFLGEGTTDKDHFSSGSVCLVLASNPYDEDDYYWDYDVYLIALEAKK